MIVLNVDDDQDDSALFCEAMKQVSPSSTCLVADSAVSALEILSDRQRIPDYIFLDINMPKMNGIECLKLIKNNHALNHIKVVMYSTNADPADLKEFRRLGALFLPKTNRYSTLVKNLSEIIN